MRKRRPFHDKFHLYLRPKFLNSEVKEYMGRRKVNFTLPLLLIIVIEMAAFFYLSAETSIFSRPSTLRSETQSESPNHDEKVLTVQLAILGYDINNLPLAKLNIQKASQLCEGYFKVLLTNVVCPQVLNEQLAVLDGKVIVGPGTGLASAWRSPIPIAYRQLLI